MAMSGVKKEPFGSIMESRRHVVLTRIKYHLFYEGRERLHLS